MVFTHGQRDQRGGSLSVHKAFLSPSIFPPKTSAEESGGFFRGESFSEYTVAAGTPIGEQQLTDSHTTQKDT